MLSSRRRVRVRPHDIIRRFAWDVLKVVAVQARPPLIGSYIADVETPDGERRRGMPAHELELVKF